MLTSKTVFPDCVTNNRFVQMKLVFNSNDETCNCVDCSLVVALCGFVIFVISLFFACCSLSYFV